MIEKEREKREEKRGLMNDQRQTMSETDVSEGG